VRRPLLAAILFLLTGLAGLGHQIVWMRAFAIGLGHELPSVLAVITAFFGGLALGAWLLDDRLGRSRHPGRWYAVLEIVIAAWAVITILIIPKLNTLAATWIGAEPGPWRHGLIAFAMPLIGLMPATFAMGASFPAMEQLVSRRARQPAVVGGLYALNTIGAALGVFITTFLLVPRFGLVPSAIMLAATNALCAALMIIGPARHEHAYPPVRASVGEGATPSGLSLTLFATGLLGVGYEVLCVRIMGQTLQNTVYTFANILTVYLIGTAIGGAIYQRFVPKASFEQPMTWMCQALALTCVFGIFMVGNTADLHASFGEMFGVGWFGSIAAEFAVAIAVLLLPTMAMGATFSHLAQSSRRQGGGVGRAMAMNTFGGALAPIIIGLGVHQTIVGTEAFALTGTKWVLTGIALSYLLLLPTAALKPTRLIPAGIAVIAVVVLPSNLVQVRLPEGMTRTWYREGVLGTVTVMTDQAGDRHLKVNDRFSMGSTRRSFADRRQAHIPLLLHPNPERALFLGIGTGMTAGASLAHPRIDFIGVELVPEVVQALPYFNPRNRLDEMVSPTRYVIGDARRFVRATDERFDVIIADLFHPARDGAGALYTREHFAAIHDRLAADGLFCQWLPLHQLDAHVLRTIIRTFLNVYGGQSFAVIAHFNVRTPVLGLVGTRHDWAYVPGDMASRLAGSPVLTRELSTALLTDEVQLLGSILANHDDLVRFAGAGPLNTDFHPRVMYEAPDEVYGRTIPVPERLAAFLTACESDGSTFLAEPAGVDDDSTSRLAERLSRYITARDLYLGGAVSMEKGVDALGFWREAVATSSDFRAAYFGCLMLLRRPDQDATEARATLRVLEAVDPSDSRLEPLRRRYGGG